MIGAVLLGKIELATFVARPTGLGTCSLRLRSSAKGGNQGQQNAAAPDFINVLSNPRLPETTPSRYALSVICQSAVALYLFTQSRRAFHRVRAR
jgi:hypothetical protein